MKSMKFLQGQVEYTYWQDGLQDGSPFWDNMNRLWVAYSYEDCKHLLGRVELLVPPVNKSGLNEYASFLLEGFARSSNGQEHVIARSATCRLFQNMRHVPIEEILSGLLPTLSPVKEFDWVQSVCKVLPLMTILYGFGFNKTDRTFILETADELVKIMLAEKTPTTVAAVNLIAQDLYLTVERHILCVGWLKDLIFNGPLTLVSKEETLTAYTCNLVGLLVQSYHAGRGLLSNALLHYLSNSRLSRPAFINKYYSLKAITEILRFDPPVVHTKRVARKNIILGDRHFNKGDQIVIMIAAANRDPSRFTDSGSFDMDRCNNDQHLTFGTGSHACVAKQLSMDMAAETLRVLAERYPSVRLIQNEITYEPLTNLRLARNIFTTLN